MKFNNLNTKLENLISSSNGKINPEELNDYSLKVYEYLKKNHTKLIWNIKLQKSDFEKNHIYIEFINKNENSASNLIFSWKNNELTVGFDCFYSHFDSFKEQNFEDEMKIALEYFYKILNEELFVVCTGGRTTTLLTNEEINIIESDRNLKNLIMIVLHTM